VNGYYYNLTVLILPKKIKREYNVVNKESYHNGSVKNAVLIALLFAFFYQYVIMNIMWKNTQTI